ncbi:Geranylgeranyl transferase type-1 subunit beta [Schistosoma japonicum]|nr:Geranylgeranyl transferase type-1 subunit beta [Schistosoma japonicum]
MVRDCDNRIQKKLQIYFKRCLGVLPNSMVSLDSSRIVVLFFATGGLALLDALDNLDKNELIEFIYSHQILSNDSQNKSGGFRGSSLIGCPSDPEKVKLNRSKYDGSHVTMVYSALASLLLLGDDLSRVDRRGTLVGLSAMQCLDEPGLFKAGDICAERDMRFVFSAVASCYILNGLDYINCENVASFIAKCLTYQGGFANLPDLEAHAGATYCAVASLSLINKLESVIPVGSKSRNLLIKWLLNLQNEGFHGRIGKPDDTCYTFWVCASLKILNCHHLVNKDATVRFVTRCWNDVIGAFTKTPDQLCTPDPLHTYLSISGLSCLCSSDSLTESVELMDYESYTHRNLQELINSSSLLTVHPELNVPEKSHQRLKQIHLQWITK